MFPIHLLQYQIIQYLDLAEVLMYFLQALYQLFVLFHVTLSSTSQPRFQLLLIRTATFLEQGIFL